MAWTTACPDWQSRIVAGQSLVPCPPMFPVEAADALEQFGGLRMVDAPGRPFMRDVCRAWLRDFVSAVFGAYDHDTGQRLVQEFMLSIAKKNGKSTAAAGIMLTALIRNWRDSAEFLILAPTTEIANNAFAPARDMIRHDEELAALLHVQEHVRTITHRGNGASLKVVAADNEAVGGKKAVGILVDETWLFGRRPGAENMLREATGGLASRPEGFVIWLTTQSDEPPAGVFKQKLQYARDVRDGKIIDPRFMPILYEFPAAMIAAGEHREPKNFYVTNPNLGASVDPAFLEREMRKAEAAGEESMRGFLAKNLNVEIGLALQSDRWVGADFWEAAGEPGITLESLIERCEVAVVGIDGGGLDDLLGLAVLGRERDTRRWILWTHAWAHRIVLERRKSIASALMDFEAQGDLTIVDVPGQDVAAVADMVCRLRDAEMLPEKQGIGVDAAGIGDIIDELTGREIGMEMIVAISQGWKLNGAIKTAERRTAGRELVHAGRPLMAWCVGNAKVEPKGNAVSITKQAAGFAKIDPLMATFNAVSLMSLNPASAQNIFSGELMVV